MQPNKLDKKTQKARKAIQDYAIGKEELSKSEIASYMARIMKNETVATAIILFAKVRNIHKLDDYIQKITINIKEKYNALCLINYDDIPNRKHLLNIIYTSPEACFDLFIHTNASNKEKQNALKQIIKKEDIFIQLLKQNNLDLTIENKEFLKSYINNNENLKHKLDYMKQFLYDTDDSSPIIDNYNKIYS